MTFQVAMMSVNSTRFSDDKRFTSLFELESDKDTRTTILALKVDVLLRLSKVEYRSRVIPVQPN
jgi:hypothetical protein